MVKTGRDATAGGGPAGDSGGERDRIRASLLRHLAVGGAPTIGGRSSRTASYSSAKRISIAGCDNAVVDRVVGSNLGGSSARRPRSGRDKLNGRCARPKRGCRGSGSSSSSGSPAFHRLLA